MKKSKVLLALACAVLLVGASIMGTLAYLTSTDTVTNTFTVGNVKIDLYEFDYDADSDTSDQITKTIRNGSETKEEKWDKNNTYHLLPGHTYRKDPTVTVKSGSEDSYIKMEVEVSFAKELDAIFASEDEDNNGANLMQIFDGYDSNKWEYKGNVKDSEKNTRTYTFWYKGDADSNYIVKSVDKDTDLPALFTAVKVPGGITNEQLATLTKTEKVDGKDVTTTMTITAKAYAIQADGFDSAGDAWAAFPAD